MKVITLISDFGLKSSYVSQMKGVILSLSDAEIIDITHGIAPHNILEGAFVLKSVVHYFPPGTVHLAVVDPGVGTDRRGIVITTPTQILVGPDNGLLIPAAKDLGRFVVYEIKNEDIILKPTSNTFHGRDVFAPVAAHILNGILFEEIGPVINDYKDLDFGRCDISDKGVVGKVIYIDTFGNIITNIEGHKFKEFFDYDKKLTLIVGKKRLKTTFVKSYGFVKPGQLLLTIGSSNMLEISINQGNAQDKLKLKQGDVIKLSVN